MSEKKFNSILLGGLFIVFIWSIFKPHDYFTWFLEVFPVFIGLVILIAVYKKFKFTRFTYLLIFLQAVILFIGGHYTYAEMPLFDWLKEVLELKRNYYDRVGHFMQGFVPAIIAREILLRKRIVKNDIWLKFIVVSICLSVSVFYEFIEWWVAIATGTAAEAFLGTQGDIWDTQWDMFLALIGALTAVIFFSKFHDKKLKEL